MTAPNRNALWAEILVDELAKSGVTDAVVAPGSRSTPMTVALARDDRIETYSHLDERSAGYFALGRGKRSGDPAAIVSTSGTAAVNFHPAVVEAHQSRTPLLVLTADRPPELRDSGANQTIDQTDLFGDAVRDARVLPEPEPTPRKLRALRTIIARAVGQTTGVEPGPVHLNVPFRKPLEPVEVEDDVPDALETTAPLAVRGRDGPFVRIDRGTTEPPDETLDALERSLGPGTRGLLVAGPLPPDPTIRDSLARLGAVTGFPIVADPLSGLRFGSHVEATTVLGGYDGYLGSEAVDAWPDPDIVFRFGASPTSKALRHYLRDSAARQIVVDPAGGWREATFTANELIEADVASVADSLGNRLDAVGDADWRGRFEAAEAAHWTAVERTEERGWEGGVLERTIRAVPDPSTVFVSNSMPVRDLDRFGKPNAKAVTVLGNRGASGIDGITSTALGAASVTDDPVVLVTGDLAYFHDMNGLLALGRFDLELTVVLINNDGGGIFHMLPIADFDPPFTEQFKTPHGLDFAPTSDLYDLEFASVESVSAFAERFSTAIERDGTTVIEVTTDAEASHRVREEVATRVAESLPR